MTRPKSCTEYWLDPATATFRGDFEGMYRDIDDPWGCEAAKTSLNNRVFLDILFAADRRFDRVLDIGCGLGGLLSSIRQRNGGAGEIVGIDISETAVAKARQKYPQIRFEQRNLLEQEPWRRDFDLVVMSEVLWYVLADLDRFYDRVAVLLAPGGILGVHQYFPRDQRYGRDVLDGLSGYQQFMQRRSAFRAEHMYTNHHSDGFVLLSTFIKER